MKLFTLFEKGKLDFDIKNDTGIEGRRWVAEVFVDLTSCSVGFFHEIKYEEYNDWKHGSGYYDFNFIFDPRKWKIHKHSIPYNGFHNTLQFGPFCFNWLS